jgi:ABC-type molybdenum transport system ATPase subunit/photorepair protein PhrA
MLRSFAALTSGITRFNREAIFRIYEDIRKDFKTAIRPFKEATNIRINDWKSASHALLDIKAVLVATRLASAPAALILDEPDWGMSRQSAIAFVSAVLAAAHRQYTPVLLISHKPWWQPIARSRVLVSRTARREDDELADPAFSITVSEEEVPK